jgi:hypothetical protein
MHRQSRWIERSALDVKEVRRSRKIKTSGWNTHILKKPDLGIRSRLDDQQSAPAARFRNRRRNVRL